MQRVLHRKVIVQPGGKVEIISPELDAGQTVDVTVLYESGAQGSSVVGEGKDNKKFPESPQRNEWMDLQKVVALISLILIVAMLVFALVVFLLMRGKSDPNEMARGYIEGNIDKFGEDVAGFIVRDNWLLKELGRKYVEDRVNDVIQWSYSPARLVAEGEYKVTATAMTVFNVDYDVLGRTYFIEASLPFNLTLRPDTRTVIVRPDYAGGRLEHDIPAIPRLPSGREAVEKAAENIQRCKHWALQNLEPIELSSFEMLNPKTMSDLDRILWGKMIENPRNRYDGFEPIEGETEWCMDYWSEAMSERNAYKRNEQFRDECRYKMVNKAVEYENEVKAQADWVRENYDVDVAPVVVNQYIRVMNWMDIDGMELLQMPETPRGLVWRLLENREEDYYDKYSHSEKFPSKDTPSEILEWWQIEEAFFYAIDSDDSQCAFYYPQLFFGRWIPIDAYGTEDKAQEYKDLTEDLQAEDEWPDWADSPDRDILIHLE